MARKEQEVVTPEEGEDFDNVVFKWDFAEDGTEGWTFDGFSPWIENGNLCAWSQDEYQATFSYEVNDVPNGTYALMNDIKVKSNMRNVQVAISSGENQLKSDAIDTADVLQQDQILDGRLEVTDNKVTITYYLDSPKDENGTTFMVGDVKLICVKETKAEEPVVEEPVVEPVEEPANPKPAEEPRPTEQPKSVAEQSSSVSNNEANTNTITVVEPEVPAVGDTKAATKKNAAKENPVKSVEKTDTIEDEQVPMAVEDESVIEDEADSETVTEEIFEEEENIEKAEESSTNTVLVTLISLTLIALIGAGIFLWRRKHI